MRNLIARAGLALLAPLPLLAACGGGAANTSASATRYGQVSCIADMQNSYSGADLASFCSCVDQRSMEGQAKEQALHSCRQSTGIGLLDDPLSNEIIDNRMTP